MGPGRIPGWRIRWLAEEGRRPLAVLRGRLVGRPPRLAVLEGRLGSPPRAGGNFPVGAGRILAAGSSVENVSRNYLICI